MLSLIIAATLLIGDNSDSLQIEKSSAVELLTGEIQEQLSQALEEGTTTPIEATVSGDLVVFCNEKGSIETVGLRVSEDEFIHLEGESDHYEMRIGKFSDVKWKSQPFKTGLKASHAKKAEPTEIAIQPYDDNEKLTPRQCNCYFVNEEQLPLVFSPKNPDAKLGTFKQWAVEHRTELKTLLSKHGALLLRGFAVQTPDDFSTVVRAVIGKKTVPYVGDGSRKKVAENVYTSSEAPPEFHIPLHNELSVTKYPVSYISFYCDVAPEVGSGQTILARTEDVTQELLQDKELWDLFNGKDLVYTSRHPPSGSFFNKVNRTHKTWQQMFDTEDKAEVERLCKEKHYDFKWDGDWLVVTRTAPAIHPADASFDHPYWFNQAHLYHANPRRHGGWLNHTLASLVYIAPSTRQYDVTFEDGSLISQDVIYSIYDALEYNTIKFDWQKGDILILDNRKVMHGRAPYKGDRTILVSMVP